MMQNEEHEETTGARPRRYEIVDAETGKPVQGVSFVLTPTGEEMHMLTPDELGFGGMPHLGVYYADTGELHGGLTGNNSLPVKAPLALTVVARAIFRQLATGTHERFRDDAVANLKGLSESAMKLWEEHGGPEFEAKQKQYNEEFSRRFAESRAPHAGFSLSTRSDLAEG